MSKIHQFLSRWLPLSKEGLGGFVLTLALFVTGLIKSINLITLLACILLAIGICNVLLAWRQIRGLKVSRDIPDFVIAGLSVSWRVKIQNDSHRARQGVQITDPALDRSLGWFVELRPGESTVLEYPLTCPTRGMFPLGKLILSSGFPLGLAWVRRECPSQDVLHVAPRLGQIQRNVLLRWLARKSPSVGALRVRPIHHPTGQMEFHGLRQFRPGDSPRLIHWRTSARRGELMVRQFEEYPNDDLVLIVDPTIAHPDQTDDFERMLSLAATICWEWCRQKGDWLTLMIASPGVPVYQGPTGGLMLAATLKALAALKPLTPEMKQASPWEPEATKTITAHLLLAVGRSSVADFFESASHRSLGIVDVAAGEERDFFES